MTINCSPIDEIIRMLKVTRAELAYADNEDVHYLLCDMAQNLDNALYDLSEHAGGDGSPFHGANAMAMELALSSVEFDKYFDNSGEVAMLDPDFEDWN